MDWLDLLAVQGTLKSLLQHHNSKASILRRSAFFMVQLSHPYMTTGKTTALTIWNFVNNVMSLLLNPLSRLVIAFPPRSKCLLISWLQSPSPVILESILEIDLGTWEQTCVMKARKKQTVKLLSHLIHDRPIHVFSWSLAFEDWPTGTHTWVCSG